MKTTGLFTILLLFVQLTFGQLTLTNQSDGIVNVEYGANGDFSLYDPQGDAEIYLYIWIDANLTNPPLSGQYNDDWGDTSGLIVINFDSNTQKYTGTIDFNTHDFNGEGVIPEGTQINDFKLILRNLAGDRQSQDLVASDYGFQPTTTAGLTELNADKIMYFSNGQLFIYPEFTKQNIDIQVFDMSGKTVLEKTGVKETLNLSNLSNQVYIIKAVINKEKFAVMKVSL